MSGLVLGLLAVSLLAALGFRLGAARLGIVLGALVAGGLAAFTLGPALHDAAVAVSGWDTVASLAIACLVIYAAAAGLVLRAAALLRLGFRAGRRPWLGAAFGGVLGSCCLALAAFSLGARGPDAPVRWVERPFEYLRAIDVLRDLTPAEEERVASRPEVQSAAASEALQSLVSDPLLAEKLLRASEGSTLALLALAAEPEVKSALDDPDLQRRVAAIDLPAIAADVLRRRRESGAPEAAEEADGLDRAAGGQDTSAWRAGYKLGEALERVLPGRR